MRQAGRWCGQGWRWQGQKRKAGGCDCAADASSTLTSTPPVTASSLPFPFPFLSDVPPPSRPLAQIAKFEAERYAKQPDLAQADAPLDLVRDDLVVVRGRRLPRDRRRALARADHLGLVGRVGRLRREEPRLERLV